MASGGLRRLVVLVAVVAAVLSGCAHHPAARVVLDGRPRVPDDEGVVVSVSRARLVLDDGRSYRIGPDLQSFSSQTMQAVPILQRKGQYVHVGADGHRARWVAAVGDVVRGDPDVVYFTGRVRSVEDRRLIFRDGTVLRLAPGVESPSPGFVIATIDPRRHLVTTVSLP
jgi:hypothetical protein